VSYRQALNQALKRCLVASDRLEEVRRQGEEMRDRHARERAALDQYKAEVMDFIANKRRQKMQLERYALEAISEALDELDHLDGWNADFRQMIRVYIAMYNGLLDGLVKEDEWEKILGMHG
jgi:hypothetical protein